MEWTHGATERSDGRWLSVTTDGDAGVGGRSRMAHPAVPIVIGRLPVLLGGYRLWAE